MAKHGYQVCCSKGSGITLQASPAAWNVIPLVHKPTACLYHGKHRGGMNITIGL